MAGALHFNTRAAAARRRPLLTFIVEPPEPGVALEAQPGASKTKLANKLQEMADSNLTNKQINCRLGARRLRAGQVSPVMRRHFRPTRRPQARPLSLPTCDPSGLILIFVLISSNAGLLVAAAELPGLPTSCC